MIRPTVPGETDVLVAIADGTGIFKPLEIVTLREVLDDFHKGGDEVAGHRAITCQEGDRILGFAYYAPTAMTDRTWHLFWIFVDKSIQAKGIGTQIIHHVEADLRSAGARLLLIETAGLPSYEPTRRFYEKLGYKQVAIIPDFYADGDDMTVYWKRM